MQNKNQEKFKIPPVSTLLGSTPSNFFNALRLGHIEPRFYPKLALTFLIVMISWPFQLYERIYFENKIRRFKFRKPPIFIIGHWRSGTTHLHNLLCKDPAHGYVTTYQSVFPNNLLSKWIFKTFMKMNMPDKRPTDNVKLDPDFPQEEEFALANMTSTAFYNFFYFPHEGDIFYKKYVRLNGTKSTFDQAYQELLTKAAFNVGKEQLVIKNPVNTGRIKALLKIYPDAKFIHIVRNPVTTYLSTLRFFKALLLTTSLQNYSEEFLKQKILENYKLFMQDYLETKDLIPEANLFEIKFEEFETNDMKYLKEIYDLFDLDSWKQAKPFFRKYAHDQKDYVKSTHSIKKDDLQKIKEEWAFVMDKYEYKIPDNLREV